MNSSLSLEHVYDNYEQPLMDLLSDENKNNPLHNLEDDENCKVGAISKFIQTKPYGPVEQDDFLNGCVEIETLYSPQELLKAVNAIEASANRTREIHWGPRTLDVDIVLYDDEIVADSNLKGNLC